MAILTIENLEKARKWLERKAVPGDPRDDLVIEFLYTLLDETLADLETDRRTNALDGAQ